MNQCRFFTDLEQALDGQPAQLTITFKNNRCVATFLPTTAGKVGGKFKPLNMNGSAEDFDAQFLEAIKKATAVVKTASIIQNEEEFNEAAAEEAPIPAKKKTEPKKEIKPVPALNKPEAGKTTLPPREIYQQVKKYLGQKLGKGKIAEKVGLTKDQVVILSNANTEDEVMDIMNKDSFWQKKENKQLDLVEDAEKATVVPPVPPAPAKVKHTDEDLATFSDLLAGKLKKASTQYDFAKEQLEQAGISEEDKVTYTGIKNRAKSIIENCKIQQDAIQAGTFGTEDDQTKLIPVAELLERLNK